MFIIILTYKHAIEVIEPYVNAHRAYLDQGYENNLLIASGPQDPRIGGVMISQTRNQQELENFIKQDPFYINDLADYELIAFNPLKYHPNFASFIEN